MMPTGAGTARSAGNGNGQDTESELGWVGQQHLMWGYCGRALAAGGPAVAIDVADARRAAPAARRRIVALHRRPRDLVVRIGPRPLAETADAPAKAA
jgi:hypothetical protein